MPGPKLSFEDFRAADRGFWRTYSMVLALGLLLGVVLLTAQAEPTTRDQTSEEFVEGQLEQTAVDILQTGNATGRLKNATLYWNPTADRWYDADQDPPRQAIYTGLPPDHPMAPVVATAENASGQFAINIRVSYETADGDRATRQLVYQGAPGRHAVSRTASVTLRDDDRILTPDGSRGCTLAALDSGGCSGSYFAPDTNEGPAYNELEVEVVLWRP